MLRDQVARLLANGLPTTFLDAINLTSGRVTANDDEINALITLHDAPNTTDGAKRVLADTLKRYAKQRASQRDDAQRVLTLADSGKTLRLRRGETVQLLLETRAHLGGSWESASADATFTIDGMDEKRHNTRATLAPKRTGTLTITLDETLAPPVKSQARSQAPKQDAKSFTLTLIVET